MRASISAAKQPGFCWLEVGPYDLWKDRGFRDFSKIVIPHLLRPLVTKAIADGRIA
jgi:hypothetical protein